MSAMRRGRRFTLRSLEDMAIDKIVENIGSYKELIQKKISPPMREVLFDKAMKRPEGHHQLWTALPYLDQHRMTETLTYYNFPSIFHSKKCNKTNMRPDITMEEFFQYIVQFVPNLRYLNPLIECKCFWFDHFVNKPMLEPSSIKQICQMQNLTHIEFDDHLYIKFSDFLELCNDRKNLEFIESDNVLLDMEPHLAKMSLEALSSQFDFQNYEEKDISMFLITLKKTNSDEPDRRASATLLSVIFDIIPPNLTHLRIDILFKNEKILVRCAPNLTHLRINIFLKNEKLSAQCEGNCLQCILARFGATLKYLYICYTMSEGVELTEISLKNICQYCSSLEKLEIYGSFVDTDDEELTSFRQLKCIRWMSNIRDAQTISLKNILTLPSLEDLYIVAYKFDLGDTEELFERIRNREILTNLRKSKIKYLMEDDPDWKLEELHATINSVSPHGDVLSIYCSSPYDDSSSSDN